MTIGVKCILPKALRNGEFISKPFRPFTTYLPLNFVLKFKKGKRFLKISNPTAKSLSIKADTALGSDTFELVRNLYQCNNIVTHLHEDIDDSIAMCSMKTAECPIHHLMENEHAATHASNCQNLYSHTPQSLDYPMCAESVQMHKTSHFIKNCVSNKQRVQFDDHQHENMMKN